MADKNMNQFTTATNGAYIYGELADGSQVKISKSDLAKALGGVLNRSIEGKDLNNCLITGNYVKDSGVYTNSPTEDASLLIVISSEIYSLQYLHELNNGGIYYRRILVYTGKATRL